MSRRAVWSVVLLVSLGLVALSLGTGGGACVDSVDPAASSCTSQGAPLLVLAGAAGVVLSVVMLRRSPRSR